jgi:hypothetical protein
MADLKAIELRLRGILAPYEDRLERGEIYGVPMLLRPGAKAHDWFAGVQPVEGAVKFNFLPMYAHPELLAGISPQLRKRRTGASVFKFMELDEVLANELAGMVARAYPIYAAEKR